MRISMFNTYDQVGGAAKAAYRLYKGFSLCGNDVHYFVRNKTELSDKNITQLNQFNVPMLTMDGLMQQHYINSNRTAISNTLFSVTYAGITTNLSEELRNSEIINLHWIEKYLSLENIKQLINLRIPIVWTLHDERPFTGGCHYTTECGGFMDDCSQCLQLKEDPHRLAKNVLAAKLDLLKDANISIVTPSRWLESQVKKSTLFKNTRVKTIANGIDVDIYKPLDKSQCKQSLGISPDNIVLQFGAQDNREKRKGFTYLVDALKHCLKNHTFNKLCEDGKITILCVGTAAKEITDLPIQTKSVGYIDNDLDMVKLYNASDIFILPSLEDNLPNSMIESMACQTPVIGFNTGGIPEVVCEDNGRVVDKEDSVQLADAIIELVLNSDLRRKLGISGHKLIYNKYKLSDQAKNYLDFFNEVLSGDKIDTNKHMEDFNAYLDPIAGYALRKEANQNNHIFNKIIQDETLIKAHASLIESIDSICKISARKNPIKKINAYKKMLYTYRQLKK